MFVDYVFISTISNLSIVIFVRAECVKRKALTLKICFMEYLKQIRAKIIGNLWILIGIRDVDNSILLSFESHSHPLIFGLNCNVHGFVKNWNFFGSCFAEKRCRLHYNWIDLFNDLIIVKPLVYRIRIFDIFALFYQLFPSI